MTEPNDSRQSTETGPPVADGGADGSGIEQDAGRRSPTPAAPDVSGGSVARVFGGDDVRPGPEFTDTPAAGGTEPTD